MPFLEPIAKTAEREGVTLSLENEGATIAGSCAEARTVADALGDTSGFSFCWDVNNGIGCGEQAIPDGYEQIKGRITHLHVKPNPDKELDPIRDSDMKYEDLLKMVMSDGYTGNVSIEHWGSPELNAKRRAATARSIGQLVKWTYTNYSQTYFIPNPMKQ